MAITSIVAATKNAASGATTQFTANGPFVLYGDGFGVTEYARLLRKGPSGEYIEATDKNGHVQVSAFPNMRTVDIAGEYEIRKTATDALASVGYEEIPGTVTP